MVLVDLIKVMIKPGKRFIIKRTIFLWFYQ